MLTKLKVLNFAIIEDADISFKDGLTVLTGETGAGKSLIIDCIGLLLGERAASEMIRQGEEKAVVIGSFDNNNPHIRAFLEKLDIPFENGIIEIKRTISTTKNVVKINDVAVSLNDLKNLSSLLADIHQQFDTIKLLNNSNYLAMVDGFNARTSSQYLAKYLESLAVLKEVNNKYQSIIKQVEDFNKNQEEYEYAYHEIKSLDLKQNEEADIQSQISLLENYDKIYELASQSKELINGDSLSDIYQIKENIDSLSSYQEDYASLKERINNAYYELEDIFDTFKRKVDRMDYDPSILNDLLERENAIKSLKKKYHRDFVELLNYQNELENLLKYKEDYSILLNEQKETFENAYKETYQCALDLHEIRENIALKIVKDIENTLKDIGLECRFQIAIVKSENKDFDMSVFTDQGIDTVEFYIETNIGEGLKPLAKIASGGELSRIMLAIKMLFARSQKIDTIIFDEIDTGISGEVANKVAKKIKDFSYSHQVITITHLPQIASLSDHHLKIEKQVINKRTYAIVKELSLEEKIHEIAVLISNDKVTEKQLAYAKEMVLKEN